MIIDFISILLQGIPSIYSFSLCSSLKIVPEKFSSNERNIKED
jgi:hypothetical protein